MRLGHFISPTSALHTPYVVPQECGRRADPRWVALREALPSPSKSSTTKMEGGRGLIILPCPYPPASTDPTVLAAVTRASEVNAWGWSANTHSMERLEKARHEFELWEKQEGGSADAADGGGRQSSCAS